MQSVDQPARFSQDILAKSTPTSLAVFVTLKDFVIVTFAVDPAVLANQLPRGFHPETRVLKDGTERAFVSAVTFMDHDFRLRACQWPTFSFGQTNYRAYVIHNGQRVGWFFGTSLATPFVLVPRHLWLLPWHHASMQFSTKWTATRCIEYNQTARGNWGNADLILEGTGEPMGCLDGFADEEDTAVVLTHPLIAYYNRRDGKVGTYNIWHDKLALQKGIARKASFELFHQLGFTTPDTKPHSILLQQTTDFTILLPPRLYNGHPNL